jgi:hypothetical protein
MVGVATPSRRARALTVWGPPYTSTESADSRAPVTPSAPSSREMRRSRWMAAEFRRLAMSIVRSGLSPAGSGRLGTAASV